MQVNNSHNYNYNPQFTSVNHPIPAFKIKTDKGDLLVREITMNDFGQIGIFKKIAAFFTDNFINSTDCPYYKKMSVNKQQYEKGVNSLKNDIIDNLNCDDGNTNILAAFDKEGKIRGALWGKTFNDMIFFDNNTYSFECLAVSNEYRHNNIGKQLVQKVINSIKPSHTDILLTANNNALDFYKRIGFKISDRNNPQINILLTKMEKYTVNNKYYTYVEKTVNPATSRWWERLYNKFIN